MLHGKQEGTGIIPHCQPRTGATNSLETPRVWPPSTAVLHTKSSKATAGLCKFSLPICQLLKQLWGCAFWRNLLSFYSQGAGPADVWSCDFKRL